jgi:hypothetical protein
VHNVLDSSKPGRLTGLVYLVLIISGAAGYSTMAFLLARTDAALTPARLAGSDTAFTAAYAALVVSFVTWVVLAFMLHRLMGRFGQRIGFAMVAFTLAGAAMNLIALSHLWPLVGTLDAGVDAETLTPRLERYERTLAAAQLFSGLWLFPFGWLVLRSRIAPQVLGWCLIIGGAAYLLDFLRLFAPDLGQMPAYRIVTTPLAVVAMIGELGMCLWLLVKGARIAQPSGC